MLYSRWFRSSYPQKSTFIVQQQFIWDLFEIECVLTIQHGNVLGCIVQRGNVLECIIQWQGVYYMRIILFDSKRHQNFSPHTDYMS